jgi:hypothetical protein
LIDVINTILASGTRPTACQSCQAYNDEILIIKIGPVCAFYVCPTCLTELANKAEDQLLQEPSHDCARIIERQLGRSWLHSDDRHPGEKVACLCGRVYRQVIDDTMGKRWELVTAVVLDADLPTDDSIDLPYDDDDALEEELAEALATSRMATDEDFSFDDRKP